MTIAYTRNENLDIDTAQLFASLASLAAYMLAGKATYTVYSAGSGQRYTFRVNCARERTEKGGWRVAHDKGPWMISARDGATFNHLGVIKIFKGRSYFFQDNWKKGAVCLASNHPARWCFEDLWNLIQRGADFPQGVVAWHHNRCGRCNLPLTTEYRHLGYGETCCGHMGIDDKAIFARLRQVGHMDERARVEMVRQMVYQGLTQDDALFARLLPGIAGDYARGHIKAA